MSGELDQTADGPSVQIEDTSAPRRTVYTKSAEGVPMRCRGSMTSPTPRGTVPAEK